MNVCGVTGLQFLISLAITILLSKSVSTGDPCPEKQELAPCICSQYRIEENNPHVIQKRNLEVSTPMPKAIENSTRATTKGSDLTPSHIKQLAVPLIGINETVFTVVNCASTKSLSILEEAVSSALHRKWVDKLIVANVPPKKEHTLAVLPERWLKNLRVTQFEIRNTILAGDFINNGNPFAGQEQNLLWFTATNCYLSGSLTFDSFGTTNTKGLNLLPRIEGVDFSKNHLVYIHNLAFRYPPANLSVVNLSYNSIRSIDASTFHYAPKLKHINLSHNLLESIVRAIFAAPARHLQNIDLSWNSLNVLPVDFFDNMPVLKVVNLRSNFLYTLSHRPWNAVWRQLTFIELTGNFLECDCGLLWLLDIISPPVVNVTTTPAPKPILGQTVRGYCRYTGPQLLKTSYKLTRLTRANLNCDV